MTESREPTEQGPVHASWDQPREPIDAAPSHAEWTEQREPLRQRERHSGLTAGIILIALGAVFLLAQIVRLENAVLFALGVGFFAAYFTTGRTRGFLVAGGVLSGLGLGTLVSSFAGLTGPVASAVWFLGFAAGWAAIYVAERSMRWVLWPAAVFLVLGAISGITAIPGFDDLSRYLWPVVLIVIGGWLLLRRQRSF